MRNKRVLVTGGAGFIGSHIAEELAADNDVVILDDFSTANKTSVNFIKSRDNITLVQGSILDKTKLEECIKDISYVFHEAAIPSVSRSIQDPLPTNMVNIGGTLNLLKTCSDAGVEKFIFASSSSVYGDTPTLPKVETMTPLPKSPYAVSKLISEHYCRVFSELFGIKTTSLRYFNVFGPRQDPHSEYAAVIPKFVNNALKGRDLVIYGDGTQTRDFTYVKDVVSANIIAAEGNLSGEVMNVARGDRITINKLAELVIEMTDSKSNIVHSEARAGDVLHSQASNKKIKDLLGWQSKNTLKQGLEKYISWIKHESS